MHAIRGLARGLLAGVFISGGLDTFRNPEPRAKQAAPVIDRVTDRVRALPQDRVWIVQANAVTQVAAASLLAAGRLPRLAALVLAGSIVPTTVGGHRFWEIDEPKQAAQQRIHALKNAAILGGLLMVVAEGK